MRVNIKPPNKQFYNERCKAARDCFKHFDIMPPFLVIYMCYSVMYRALGGNFGVLRWGDCRNRLWWTWHLYIRCRSRGEIQEILDRQLEELTGEDERERPDVVTVEEEVRQ